MGTEKGYTWRPFPKLRPLTKLCFYWPTPIKNKAHARIKETSLAAEQATSNCTILGVIGDQLTTNEIVEHTQMEWPPSNGFHVQDLGKNYFKLIFRIVEDQMKTMVEEWTSIRSNL